MNIKAHWAAALTAALILGACSTKPTDITATDTSASSDTNTSSVTVVAPAESSIDSGPIVLPGSSEDFTLNVLDRVYFGYDRYDLSADATATLDNQVRWLKRYGNADIVLGGHADNRGTREYNLALSERRAQSVRDYMVGLGINADRITVVAYGKERPAVIGNNEEAWAENRRTVTNIVAQ